MSVLTSFMNSSMNLNVLQSSDGFTTAPHLGDNCLFAEGIPDVYRKVPATESGESTPSLIDVPVSKMISYVLLVYGELEGAPPDDLLGIFIFRRRASYRWGCPFKIGFSRDKQI